MIRIMTATEPKAIKITVDGQLAGESVEAVDTHVSQAIGDGRPILLFLRDVSSIDENGRGLLSRLAAQGVRLSAAGVYSSFVVTEISRSAAQANGRR